MQNQLEENAGSDGCERAQEPFETRFFDIGRAACDPDALATLVQDALDAVGCGSVIPVVAGTLKGIQVTLPVNLLHNIESLIEGYIADAIADGAALKIWFSASVDQEHLEAVENAIRELNILPPGVRMSRGPFPASTSKDKKLYFSGSRGRSSASMGQLQLELDKIEAINGMDPAIPVRTAAKKSAKKAAKAKRKAA